MKHTSKELCKIRTITTFLSLSQDQSCWESAISKAANFCAELAETFIKNGYTVQTIRIVTNPFGEYLDTTNLTRATKDLEVISKYIRATNVSKLRIRFSIGQAKTQQEIELLPELIQLFGDLCSACVNIDLDEFGVLNSKLIEHCAQSVLKISQITERGEGNFNFTVNFNCAPLTPYFPSAYHQTNLNDCFTIGLETTDLLVCALKNSKRNKISHNASFKKNYEVMHVALQHHTDNIKNIINSFEPHDFAFAGIDSSAAPSKDCASIVNVYKLMGIEYFGAAGTVEASALLTKVFKSITGVTLVGFSGLMLALTEDTGLAQGTHKANFDIRALLTYSAVCGIGLDTVPIPGDTPITKITALMRDTGTMAFRLNKPLTVRLFPVLGLKAGDKTSFINENLCNCAVLAVP